MFEKQKQIDGYCLRQTEQSVVIDERRGLILSIFDLIFGLFFMFPLYLFTGAALLKKGVLGMGPPNYSQFSMRSWLVLLPVMCMILGFAFVGFFQAFVRSRVKATDEKIFKGNTWFGVPLNLKAMPVSEMVAIKLEWILRRGPRSGGWHCVVSIVSAQKSVLLFSCSKKEAALELANAVAEITKLSVQDIPQS